MVSEYAAGAGRPDEWLRACQPLLDLASLPFESSFKIARVPHKRRPGKPAVM